MRYDYRCLNCSNDKEWIVFEVRHGISEKPTIKCPLCGKTNCERALLDNPVSYTRGYGWLDKRGRNRDMNLHKLVNDDPYGHMRETGEADDLANRLRTGGKEKKRLGKITKIGGKKQTKPKEQIRQIGQVRIRRVEYKAS